MQRREFLGSCGALVLGAMGVAAAKPAVPDLPDLVGIFRSRDLTPIYLIESRGIEAIITPYSHFRLEFLKQHGVEVTDPCGELRHVMIFAYEPQASLTS